MELDSQVADARGFSVYHCCMISESGPTVQCSGSSSLSLLCNGILRIVQPEKGFGKNFQDLDLLCNN
jgi:hypothetical protein